MIHQQRGKKKHLKKNYVPHPLPIGALDEITAGRKFAPEQHHVRQCLHLSQVDGNPGLFVVERRAPTCHKEAVHRPRCGMLRRELGGGERQAI